MLLILSSLLFVAVLMNADPDIILGGLVIAVLGVLWFARGPRVETIRIDRDALVHERRSRSIRRIRSHDTHALESVAVLRARWPGADALSRRVMARR